MAYTNTTALANEVKPYYDAEFLMASTGKEYFDQLAWVKLKMNGERGSEVDFPIIEGMDPATATLGESTDITPVAVSDSNVALLINEYGNAATRTLKLRATAFTDVEKAIAKAMGINRARSIDIVVRDVAVGGTNVARPNARSNANTAVARATLVSGTDNLSWGFLTGLVGRARSWNIPAQDDDNYVCVIHPLLLPDLQSLPNFIAVAVYQKNGSEIYDGEVGMLGGVRFVTSYNAKVYLSGGQIGPAATTITQAQVAGDTTITVASTTSLAVGDFVTVGTLESSIAEQVQITAINGSILTITGIGNSQSNFGLRYGHANGVAVTKADAVYAMPLLGPQSIGKVYSDLTGPVGDVRVTGPFDVLGRFVNVGWFALAGWGIVSQKWIIRGEVAGSLKHIGANQY